LVRFYAQFSGSAPIAALIAPANPFARFDQQQVSVFTFQEESHVVRTHLHPRVFSNRARFVVSGLESSGPHAKQQFIAPFPIRQIAVP
jgi:hypothetical protein